MNVLMNLFNR